MTHEEMFEYLNKPVKELVSPLIYQQFFKNNLYAKHWTGRELAVAIGQNNLLGYNLGLPEVHSVALNNGSLILNTDAGECPIEANDDYIQHILKYSKHVQLAFVQHPDGTYFCLVTAGPTEKEAKQDLISLICKDIIEALDICTPGKLTRLYSESMSVYRHSR